MTSLSPWAQWTLTAVVVLAAIPAAWFVSVLLMRLCLRFLGIDRKTEEGATYRKSRQWLAASLYFLVLVAILPLIPLGPAARVGAGKIIIVLFTLTLTLFLAQIAVGGIRHFARGRQLALPMTSLTENVIRLVVLVVGILLILGNLGIQITPLLTALGIGSLAIALALQDTLAGLFAGFHLMATKDLRTGDYIQIAGGKEGYIADIGWRRTRIRELAGNLVLVPNTELVKATVVNTHLPAKDLAVLVNLGVSYDSDLDHVEAVTVDVAQDVMKTVHGGVPEFEPFVRFHTFGPYSIDFTVILRGQEFVDQYLIKHEFIRRLQRRYREEGIEIPVPQRVVQLREAHARTGH